MYILIGNYGSSNIGDEAIAHGFIKQLSSEQHKIILLSHNPTYSYKALNQCNFEHQNIIIKKILPTGVKSFLTSIWTKEFWQTLKNIKKTDKIIFGGGGLLQDDEIKAIWIWGIIFTICRFLNKNIEWRAVSIGPLHHKISIFITNIIINKSKIFSIRDKNIPTYIKNKAKITFEKDGTDILDPLKDYNIVKSNTPNHITIGISLRNHKTIDETFINNLNKYLNQIISTHKNIHFITLPFETYNCDDRKILSKLQISKPTFITEILTPTEMIQHMINIDILIGMRLHSLLLAEKINIPTIPIIYSPKINFYIKNLDTCKLNTKTFDWDYFYYILSNKINEKLA